MSDLNTGLHYPIDLARLPESWAADYVGEFCDMIQSGFACGSHSESDIGIGHLRPMNISREGRLDFAVMKFVPTTYDDRRLVVDDVLFNNTNSPELIGKTAYVSTRGSGLGFSNHMTRLQFGRAVDPRFAAYQLHFLWMAKYFLHACVKHVNQASISTHELSLTVPFVAPPLNEQRRIVAKIEELFSELDAGIASLKTAREQLNIYRRALLKHAFEGKLTDAWRAKNIGRLEGPETLLSQLRAQREELYRQKLSEWKQIMNQTEANGTDGRRPPKPENFIAMRRYSEEELATLPVLPVGWHWLKLADIVGSLDQGWSPRCENRVAGEHDWAVIKTTAVQPLAFRPGENKVLPEALPPRPWLEIKPDDILITRAGPRTRAGIACRVDSTRQKLMICDKVYRLRLPTGAVSPKFVEALLNSPSISQEIERLKTGINDSGVNLTQKGLLSLAVPVPSHAEQVELMNTLSSKLTNIESMEQDIESALRRSEALRQSILKRAFSGQLVPHDPSDEPTSALLERIRAERATRRKGGPHKRKRGG